MQSVVMLLVVEGVVVGAIVLVTVRGELVAAGCYKDVVAEQTLAAEALSAAMRRSAIDAVGEEIAA